MVYNTSQELKKDFDWLTQTCTLEHFLASRLSPYDYDAFLSKITLNIDDTFILQFFNELLVKFDLQETKYSEKVNNTMLPLLALVPNRGLQIIIELQDDNLYKILDANGTQTCRNFPENTIMQCRAMHKTRVPGCLDC